MSKAHIKDNLSRSGRSSLFQAMCTDMLAGKGAVVPDRRTGRDVARHELRAAILQGVGVHCSCRCRLLMGCLWAGRWSYSFLLDPA